MPPPLHALAAALTPAPRYAEAPLRETPEVRVNADVKVYDPSTGAWRWYQRRDLAAVPGSEVVLQCSAARINRDGRAAFRGQGANPRRGGATGRAPSEVRGAPRQSCEGVRGVGRRAWLGHRRACRVGQKRQLWFGCLQITCC